MRGTRWCRFALGLVSIGVAAGCRSLPGPPSLLDGGLVSSPRLTPEQDRAAQAYAFYSIGIHHELADEYDLAHEAYRRAAEFDPASERLVLRMASTLVLQRKTDDALRTVEEFLQRNPASESALIWLATFYGTTGDTRRVRQLFQQMTRQFPERPLGWLQLAAATARDGTPKAVIDILEAGLSKARPATALRQELARLHLTDMQSAGEEKPRTAARQRAIGLLRQIAEEVPGDAETLYALGDLLVQDGQLAEAVRVYETIERLHPADVQVQQRLARIFLAMDDLDQAIAILEGLADDRSGPGNVPYYLAELYLEAGDIPNAIRYFREAADTLEGDPTPWLKLAALQSEQSDTEAVATLEEALELMPGDPRLLEVLALVRMNQKRYSQAADLLDQVWAASVATDPDAVPSNLFFYNYAAVCTHLRRTQDAADWLRRATDQEPALLDLYVQRAMVGTARYRRTAMAVLRAMARQPSPEAAAIRAHLGALFLAQDQPARAVGEFERVLATIRQDPLQSAILTPRFHFWFGVALDQSGQSDRAIEQFEDCIRLDPNHADALNYAAYMWALQATRLDDALRYIQTALSLDPDNAAYIDTLGWIYYQQGRYEEALEQLLRADELRPDDPEILEHIEKTLEKLGR